MVRDTCCLIIKTHGTAGSLTSGFRHICTVKADLSPLNSDGIKLEKGSNGEYWKAKFQVVVTLPIGGAQLQARMQWYEKVGVHALKVSCLIHYAGRPQARTCNYDR